MHHVRRYAWSAFVLIAFGCSTASGPSESTTIGSHADPNGACGTACDCDPGLACADGKCTRLATAIYCCGATACPAAAVCQSRAGTMATCVGPVAAPDLSTTATPVDLATTAGDLANVDLNTSDLKKERPDLDIPIGSICYNLCNQDSDCAPGCGVCKGDLDKLCDPSP